MSSLTVDRDQIAAFTDAMFRHASEGGHVSLRAFLDLEDGLPVVVKGVRLNGSGLAAIVDQAHIEAQRTASYIKPAVFCPPIATFSNPQQAREQDLVEAYALSVECDQRAKSAVEKLSQLLGRPTVIVASGGDWIDPTTGEIEPKLHLHWRLTEPASGADLQRLKQARRLATALVGGDPTNVPMVHPIRWPGSWHRKAEPRLVAIKELNDGAEIDLCEALERLREAAPEIKPAAANDESRDPAASSDYDGLIASVLRGENFHASLDLLASKVVGSGMTGGAAVLFLRGIMQAYDGPKDVRWQARYNDIWRDVATAEAKFRQPERPQVAVPPNLILINPADWGNRLAPVRQWAWEGWMPARQATYLTGAGSTGKSLLAQQLASCTALGRPFLGVDTRPAAAIYLTCEDDADELHRRQDAICEALDVPFSALGGRLYLASLAGAQGNELATFDAQNRMETTPAWDRLRETVLRVRPGLVALDNVAHLFAGNENVRNHVAAFCGLLNGLAAEAETAILFIGHPNKAGGNFSGSTAWENQVRSRIFLGAPDGDDAPIDPDARVLSREKSNYARRGEKIDFRWYRWAFVRDDDLAPNVAEKITTNILAKMQDERFLACLAKATEERRNVSTSRSASNFAPKLFATMPTAEGVKQRAFESAMGRLLHDGRIIDGQPVFRRANRSWVTGLSAAPTLAPTLHQTPAPTCTEEMEKSL